MQQYHKNTYLQIFRYVYYAIQPCCFVYHKSTHRTIVTTSLSSYYFSPQLPDCSHSQGQCTCEFHTLVLLGLYRMGHRYLSRLKGRREDERLFRRENCMHPCYLYRPRAQKTTFFSLSKFIVLTRPPRPVESFFLEACTCTAFLAMCPKQISPDMLNLSPRRQFQDLLVFPQVFSLFIYRIA